VHGSGVPKIVQARLTARVTFAHDTRSCAQAPKGTSDDRLVHAPAVAKAEEGAIGLIGVVPVVPFTICDQHL
jgi:hypothetical protein